jgi:hypothetical protein
MSRWLTVAYAASTLNALALAALCAIWGRNFLRFRAKHPLGLLTFGLLLLAKSALSLYYYAVDPTLSAWFATAVPPVVWRATMALHVVETLALGILLRITLD